MANPVYAALQFAEPGRWYISPELRLRVWCRCVIGHLVYLAEHPGADESLDDAWKVTFFHQAFVPCEDLRYAHKLGPCSSTCPTCFHVRINAAVDRVLAKHQRALYDKRRRAALLRQKRGTVRKTR